MHSRTTTQHPKQSQNTTRRSLEITYTWVILQKGAIRGCNRYFKKMEPWVHAVDDILFAPLRRFFGHFFLDLLRSMLVAERVGRGGGGSGYIQG